MRKLLKLDNLRSRLRVPARGRVMLLHMCGGGWEDGWLSVGRGSWLIFCYDESVGVRSRYTEEREAPVGCSGTIGWMTAGLCHRQDRKWSVNN